METKLEDLWDYICSEIGFDEKGKEHQDAIKKFVVLKGNARLNILKKEMNELFPFKEEYNFLPDKEIARMIGQGEVMIEFNKKVEEISK